MKASKQRQMMKAIVSNKALKGIDAKRLTDMQGKVMDSYNPFKKSKLVHLNINGRTYSF
jgi:hypothetical protein